MNTKNKLVLVSIILSIGFIYLAYSIFFSVQNINLYHKTQTKIEKLNTDLLTLRRNEKDFLLRKDEKYIKKHTENLTQLLLRINTLNKDLDFLEVPFSSKIDLVKIDFMNYQTEFQKLSKEHKIHGYTNEDGLLGKLEKNKIEILNYIASLNDNLYTRYSYFVQISSRIIYNDKIELIHSLKKQLEILKKLSTDNEKIQNVIDNYESNILTLIDSKSKIGFNEDDGLRGSMRSAIHSAENSLRNISLEIEYLLETKQQKFINIFILKTILLFVIILLFSLLVYRSIHNDLNKLEKSEQDNKKLNAELEQINEHLQEKVEIGIKKNLQHEIQLFESAKLAAMGSMIGNIIHQWKQPLTAISIIASSIHFRLENNNKLPNNEIIEEMDKINGLIKRLDSVTQTFRNFLKEKKQIQEIVVQERIEKSLIISGTVLKDKGINLIKNISMDENIIIKTVPNELTEVIINIINNAVDIIEEKEIEDGEVIVSLIKENNMVIISIEDNGGGIPLDVMPHIFEQYFSTKDENKGTGLGLYMSYKIVTESLHGKLYAKNTNNGANFFIELPLDLNI